MNISMVLSRMEYWAKIVLEKKMVDSWVEGAIFPCEMVFFMAVCEVNGCKHLIESGRQDGYSTEYLAYLAETVSGTVFSVDLEEDLPRARKCKEHLSKFPQIRCLKGDGKKVIGSVLRRERPEVSAVLVDGPKRFDQLSILFASAKYSHVKVVAGHNIDDEHTLEEYKIFTRFAPKPVYYEDLDYSKDGFFAQLQNLEALQAVKVGTARSLQHSTLAVMVIEEEFRRKLYSFVDYRFKLLQPFMLYVYWQLH